MLLWHFIISSFLVFLHCTHSVCANVACCHVLQCLSLVSRKGLCLAPSFLFSMQCLTSFKNTLCSMKALQMRLKMTQFPDTIKTTLNCISDLKWWMTTNKLQTKWYNTEQIYAYYPKESATSSSTHSVYRRITFIHHTCPRNQHFCLLDCPFTPRVFATLMSPNRTSKASHLKAPKNSEQCN